MMAMNKLGEEGNIADALSRYSNFALARYTPNGGLDASFDGDGKAITDVGGTVEDIALVRYHDAVRLYVQQDANFNVTAVTDSAGTVLERYIYEPYGEFTVLESDWAIDADGLSDNGQTHLHQGGRYDAVSGTYHFRNRDFSPSLGRWVQQDPMGYVDGMNMYEYLASSPAWHVDPAGTNMAITGHNGHMGIAFDVWDYCPDTDTSVKIGVLTVDFHAIGYMGGQPTNDSGDSSGSSRIIGNVINPAVPAVGGQFQWQYSPGRTINGLAVIKGTQDQDESLLSEFLMDTGLGELRTGFDTPASTPIMKAIAVGKKTGRSTSGHVKGRGIWSEYRLTDRTCFTYVKNMVGLYVGNSEWRTSTDGYAVGLLSAMQYRGDALLNDFYREIQAPAVVRSLPFSGF